jgi:hypothetical protein
MKKLVTVASFMNSFDIQFNLFKDMLEEAGIGYIVVNENRRSVGGALVVSPTNVTIEIKVDEENAREAFEILQSIK